jgi:hypothetical protein
LAQFGLVLDVSALIPCGDKPEELKEAIRQLGYILNNLDCVTIYFSAYLIKVYHSVFSRELKYHHPLPPFQASLLRLLPNLMKITKTSRGFLCKINQTESGIKYHILETTRVKDYDVNDVGLMEEDDKEILRIALAVAPRHRKVFLVSADRHFLENVNRTELSRKYRNESQKIDIVAPNDPNFMEFLNRECRSND